MVSIEKYPCFCGAGLERIVSKKDERAYVKCRGEGCTLFCHEERYQNIMDAYETKVAKEFKPNKFPLCKCGYPGSLMVSQSSNNPERPYFRCQSIVDGEKCSFFHWGDATMNSKIIMKKRKVELNDRKRKEPKEKEPKTVAVKKQKKRANPFQDDE